MKKALLDATEITLEKDLKNHVELINNILTNGVLSHAKAAELKIGIVTGADVITNEKQDNPNDIVHVNLIIQGKNIENALYQGLRGGISVALERKNDNLPRKPAPISEESQKEINKEKNERFRKMMIATLNKNTVLTQKAIETLSERAHRTILVITDLDGAKEGFISLGEKTPNDKNIEELNHYADLEKVCESREHELFGSLDPAYIKAIIVPERLQNHITSDKVYFTSTIEHMAEYYKESEGSESVFIKCPNYGRKIEELLVKGDLGSSAKSLFVMHMVKF